MESKKLLDYQNKIFDIVIYITWILYFLIITGISVSAPKYLNTFDSYVKIYVSLFLLWRFNFFKRNTQFTDLDRKIAFSAGLFLFTTSALNQILVNNLEKIKEFISSNIL
jgi:hypothetical protein